MEFQSPSGRTYSWNKPNPPTEKDWEELVAYDKSLDAASSGATLTTNEKPSVNSSEESLKDTARGIGLEVGGAIAGGVAGTFLGGPVGSAIGAAAGGSVGNYLKQLFEVGEGKREDVSPGQIAATGILSLPGSVFAGKALGAAAKSIIGKTASGQVELTVGPMLSSSPILRTAAIRATQGGVSAVAAKVAEDVLDKGELPTFQEVVQQGGLGAAFGGALGGVEGRYATKGSFITNPLAAQAARGAAAVGASAYAYNDAVDKGDPNPMGKAFAVGALTYGATYLPQKILELDRDRARRVVLGPERVVGRETVLANKELKDKIASWEDYNIKLGNDLNKEIAKADDPQGLTALVLSIRDKKAGISAIPEQYGSVRTILEEARKQNAKFSSEILDGYGDVLGDDLRKEIEENSGSYIRTTYAAHDPRSVRGTDWDVKEARDAYRKELVDDALDEAKSKGASISREKAERRADGIMARMAGDVAFMASGVAPARIGGEGSSVGSALARRHDLSDKAKAWLGEQKDPGINIANSLSAQARLVMHDEHDRLMHDILVNSGIASKELKEGYKKLVAEDNPTLHHRLKDLFVPAEWADAWKEVMSPNLIGDGLAAKTMMKLTTASKAMKTVGNLFESIAPQGWGNLLIAASSGRVSPSRLLEGAKLAWKDLGWIGSGELTADARIKFNQHIRELQSLGMIKGGAEAEELRTLMGMAVKEKSSSSLFDKMSKLYGMPDSAFRYMLYKNNLDEIRGFNLGLGEDDLKRMAARVTNDTFPTYDLIPRRLRQASAVGAANSFGAFEFEMMRNSVNQVKYSHQLISEGRKLIKSGTDAGVKSGRAMVNAGIRRFLSLVGVASSTAGVAVAANEMLGTSKRDAEDLKKLLPGYDKDKALVLKLNKDGSFSYTPLNYLMPYANMVGALNEGINGRNPLPYAKTIVLGDDLGPLLTPAVEALTNTYYGTNVEITEPRDNKALVERMLIRAFVPQAVTGTLTRTEKALRGEVNKLGTKYTLEDQGLRIIGARQNTMDILGSATARIRSVIDPINGEVTGYRRLLKNNIDPATGQVGNIDENAIYAQRARAYELKQKELGEQFMALKRLGEKTGAFGDNEIISAFRQAGVPNRLIAGAAFGFTVPMPRGLAESNSEVIQEILAKPDGQRNILSEVKAKSLGDPFREKQLLQAYKAIRVNDARGGNGITKLFGGLGVSDGERAEIIYRAMAARPEFAPALKRKLMETRVMTPEVYRQVKNLIDAEVSQQGPQ